MSAIPTTQPRPAAATAAKNNILDAWSNSDTPYSQEAEEAVLGALIINSQYFADIALMLTAADFFILRHRYIWQSMVHLHESDDPIDYLTLCNRLKDDGHLTEIGGPVYITQLVNAAPTSVQAKIYAATVQRTAERRRLLVVSDEIKALAMNMQIPVEDVRLTAQSKLDAAFSDAKGGIVMGNESIEAYNTMQYETTLKIEAGEMVAYPMPSSMGALAELVPAITPGDFIVISGDSGSGKSCALEQIGEHTAGLGIRSKYIHTEMSTAQIFHRRMARHSGLPYGLLLTAGNTATQKGYTPEQRVKYDAGESAIAQFAEKLIYEWTPDVQWEKLQMQMRRDAAAGVKVFLIDHFQDITVNAPNGREENAVRAFEKACIWLAAFAEKRQVVVIVASQENKQGKTKWTTKLKEKAVTLISVKRKELYNEYVYSVDGVEVRAVPGEKSPVAEFVVSKARFGKTGTAKLINNGPRFRWLDITAVRRNREYPTFNGAYYDEDDIPQ